MHLLRIALFAGIIAVTGPTQALDLDDSDGNGISDQAETEIDLLVSENPGVARSDLLALARVFFTLIATAPADPAFNGAVQAYAQELDCLETKYPRIRESLQQGVISGTLFNFERNKAYARSHKAAKGYLEEARKREVEFHCARK